MSSWTYINGIITVQPMGRTQAEKRYILDTILDHLPRVRGSEGDMDVYVLQKKGSDTSQSCDEFGDITNNLTDSCGNKSRNRGWLRTQSQYMIIVDGSLRDTEFEGTKRSFMKWLCRLAKRVWIRTILVNINGYDKELLINEQDCVGNPYFKMEEYPSWSDKSDGSPAWCEYLMWDKAKHSGYPVLLEYKYYDNKDNDDEAERRIEYQNEAFGRIK